ncbi:MAG: hypothetical protein WBL23_05840 [Salinisphaera sp.]|uniref:hypothetical protein n=1 Tax=Salinisphaera sp. TaxID=1914330 RepID=UPI003C7A5512
MVTVVAAFVVPMVVAPAIAVVVRDATVIVVASIVVATVVLPTMFPVAVVVSMGRHMAIRIRARAIMVIEIMGLGGTHACAKQCEASQRRGQEGKPA